MCYERRAWRQRAEEDESRRIWDEFNQGHDKPPEKTEPEVRLEGERETAEEREPVER
jgi:hypothetical protein